MSDKVPCSECGALILPTTAAATGGLCMPCKTGNRQSIERAKEFYKKQRKYNPLRELWKSLVNRVHNTESGFGELSHPEQVYWCVSLLEGEVYNGGFDQFFTNSSGEHFKGAMDGLLELNAPASFQLLREAADILFDGGEVPTDRGLRLSKIKNFPGGGAEEPDWCIRLDQLDKAYCANPDGLAEKLDRYAEDQGLVTPFKIDPTK